MALNQTTLFKRPILLCSKGQHLASPEGICWVDLEVCGIFSCQLNEALNSAMQPPRLWFWQNRLKLLAIVALAYYFLMDKFTNWNGWAQQLFRNWRHRTGSRYRIASVPAYRLRMAISNCLFFFIAQNSGCLRF